MTQNNPTDERQQAPQEELLAYPFPLADHSLEVADQTIYERLQAECPVARVLISTRFSACSERKERNVYIRLLRSTEECLQRMVALPEKLYALRYVLT